MLKPPVLLMPHDIAGFARFRRTRAHPPWLPKPGSRGHPPPFRPAHFPRACVPCSRCPCGARSASLTPVLLSSPPERCLAAVEHDRHGCYRGQPLPHHVPPRLQAVEHLGKLLSTRRTILASITTETACFTTMPMSSPPPRAIFAGELAALTGLNPELH